MQYTIYYLLSFSKLYVLSIYQLHVETFSNQACIPIDILIIEFTTINCIYCVINP